MSQIYNFKTSRSITTLEHNIVSLQLPFYRKWYSDYYECYAKVNENRTYTIITITDGHFTDSGAYIHPQVEIDYSETVVEQSVFEEDFYLGMGDYQVIIESDFLTIVDHMKQNFAKWGLPV